MQADLLLQSLKSKCSSSLWTQIEPRTNDKVLENNSIVYMQLYMRSIRLKQHLNSVLGSGEGCTFFIHPTNMALAVDFSGFLFSFPVFIPWVSKGRQQEGMLAKRPMKLAQ